MQLSSAPDRENEVEFPDLVSIRGGRTFCSVCAHLEYEELRPNFTPLRVVYFESLSIRHHSYLVLTLFLLAQVISFVLDRSCSELPIAKTLHLCSLGYTGSKVVLRPQSSPYS